MPDRQLKPNPSRSTIGADIVFLESVINWDVAEGLLAKHPFKGYDRPKTIKPKRPVASYERYERTRRKADEVDEQGLFGAFLDHVPRTEVGCRRAVELLEHMARPRSARTVSTVGRVRLHVSACGAPLGNEQRECPIEKCGYVDRKSRDPGVRLLGFHAYRRKWATERKHLPVKDVAEAGGWLDTRSLELCYQQADEETMLAVVSEPRKLRETIAPGGR